MDNEKYIKPRRGDMDNEKYIKPRRGPHVEKSVKNHMGLQLISYYNDQNGLKSVHAKRDRDMCSGTNCTNHVIILSNSERSTRGNIS